MANESLEELIKASGIKPTSEKAAAIRKKCRPFFPVSKSDFEFVLSRLESGASDNARSEESYASETRQKPRSTKPKIELLRYGKATGYVLKRAPQLDPSMLVANVDPFKETGDEFFYTKKSLDSEIARAIKYGLYGKTGSY